VLRSPATPRALVLALTFPCLGACAGPSDSAATAVVGGAGGATAGAGAGLGGAGAGSGGQGATGGIAGALASGGAAGATTGGASGTDGGGAGSSAGSSTAGGGGGAGGAGAAGAGGIAAGDGGTAGGGASGAGENGGAGVGGVAGAGGTAGTAGAAGMNGDPCGAVRVGAGDMFTCALTGDGSVYCWGSNAEAGVGRGAASRQLTPYLVTAAGNDNVDLLVGHHVTCVKKVSGAFSCWGTFDDGPGFSNVQDPRVFDVFGDDVRELVVDTSACVIRQSDGSVACWGYGNTAATTIAGFGNDSIQIALEFNTVCVVKAGGTVMCETDNDAPRTVSGVSDAVNVGLRRDHNGLGEPEDVMAAGADGRAYYAHNGAAFQPMNLAGQKAVYWNAQHHLIGAISDTGGVMLWHSAICGGFGDNNPPEDNGSTAGDRRNYTQNAPAVPTGFSSGATRDLALGHEHACVIRASDSSVCCWGRNVEGQIGNGARATECEVGAGSHDPGPDGNQMTPYKVTLCQ